MFRVLKKWSAAILLGMLLMLILAHAAADSQQGDYLVDFIVRNWKNVASITRYTGPYCDVLTIPSSFAGQPTAVIARQAISGTSAKEVIIPESVEYIQWNGFEGISSDPDKNLEKVVFLGSPTLSSGEYRSFNSMMNIRKVVLPDAFGGTAAVLKDNFPKAFFMQTQEAKQQKNCLQPE